MKDPPLASISTGLPRSCDPCGLAPTWIYPTPDPSFFRGSMGDQSHRWRYRRSPAGAWAPVVVLILLSLGLLGAPIAAADSSSPSANTLTTFADGNTSDTLHFRTPCWNNATRGFLFPDGANVTAAALTVTRGDGDQGVSG